MIKINIRETREIIFLTEILSEVGLASGFTIMVRDQEHLLIHEPGIYLHNLPLTEPQD